MKPAVRIKSFTNTLVTYSSLTEAFFLHENYQRSIVAQRPTRFTTECALSLVFERSATVPDGCGKRNHPVEQSSCHSAQEDRRLVPILVFRWRAYVPSHARTTEGKMMENTEKRCNPVRLSADIGPDLYRKLRIRVAEKDTTIREYVSDLLRCDLRVAGDRARK